MLQDFLSSCASASSSSPVTKAQPGAASGFKSLFASGVLTQKRLNQPAAITGANGSNESNEATDLDAPVIELIREEGKVSKIVVTCTCCRRIELECEY